MDFDWDDVGGEIIEGTVEAVFEGGGWRVALLGIGLLLLLVYLASLTAGECKRTCPSDFKPQMVERDCLCVEKTP